MATESGTAGPRAPCEPLAEGHVPPAQVRRHRDEPVAAPDDADDRDADADDGVRRRPAPSDPSASSARSATIASTEEWPRGRSTRTMLEDLAAEADERRGQRVDRDLEGQHDRAVGLEPDER